jgi:hypothetical protein
VQYFPCSISLNLIHYSKILGPQKFQYLKSCPYKFLSEKNYCNHSVKIQTFWVAQEDSKVLLLTCTNLPWSLHLVHSNGTLNFTCWNLLGTTYTFIPCFTVSLLLIVSPPPNLILGTATFPLFLCCIVSQYSLHFWMEKVLGLIFMIQKIY